MGAVAPYAIAMFLLATVEASTWRFFGVLIFGAVPPAIVLAATWGAEESEEFQKAVARLVYRLRLRALFDYLFECQRRDVGSSSAQDEKQQSLRTRSFMSQLQLGFSDPQMPKV